MSRFSREATSVVLMCGPLGVAAISAVMLLPTTPATVSIHVDREGAVDGTAPTWVMLAVAMVVSLAAACLAVAGLRESWRVNRRVQRAVLGSAAAVATVLWISSVALTQRDTVGVDPTAPPIVLGVFGAIFWGILCLVVTPPDPAPPYAEESPA